MTNKIKKLAQVSAAMGEIGVAIIEKESDFKLTKETIADVLIDLGYRQVLDYLSLMNSLEKNNPVFYLETAKTINNQIAEIIKEYKGGLVSLMDRKGHTGLKTVKFVPRKSPLILIFSREQVETAPADLFEAVGPMESFK